MKNQERPWVRRVLFVDRRYRSALFMYGSIISVSAAVLNYLASLLASTVISYSPGLQSVLSSSKFPVVVGVISLLITFTACIAFGLLISHRLVRPFFRMRRHMDSVTEGRTQKTEFHFRQDDFFVEVGESYNRLLQVIQAQRRRLDQGELDNQAPDTSSR